MSRIAMSDARVRIFICYSHYDAGYLEDDSLLGFLRGLEREGVELWSDQRLATGEKWDREIRTRIRSSEIALVLVSQAFLDSEYCTNVEIASETVVVSSATQGRIDHRFGCERLGHRKLPGISRPVTLYRVLEHSEKPRCGRSAPASCCR